MALFGVILLSCFLRCGAEGRLAQDKLHTHMQCTQAPCLLAGWSEQGLIHPLRNLLCASHDCSGRHLRAL